MSELRDFTLPDLGEGLTEAEVVRWLAAVGDRVEVDQPIAEVSTAKAEVQVPSPFAGVVHALHAQPGDTVEVGRPLITVEVGTPEAVASGPPAPTPSPSAPGEPAEPSGNVLVGYGTAAATRRRRRVLGEPVVAFGGEPAAEAGTTASGGQRTPGSPAAASGDQRTLVSPAAASDGERVPEPPAVSPGVERVPLSRGRRVAAERLSRSHAEIPAATAWVSADASRLLELRDLVASRHPHLHVTPLAVLLRLTVAALARFPGLNASFDAATGEVVRSTAIHLGVATRTENGLVVPVIRDAQERSIGAMAAELDRLARSAREGSVAVSELRGSTFTVSNFGGLGVDCGIAIINPPEAAILGVGRILVRPWVVEGAVVARPVLELSLAFDHRVSDGADAAGFLRFLGDLVTDPALALDES